MSKKECEHNWQIFRDTQFKEGVFLTFFCRKCLVMKKVKKEYAE